MPYKVFFVEDEIVTREGIRDNVDWQADGFELCGEASDGETALPFLQKIKPDLLITDIKMPFMDGLQLCKVVQERMPWMKVIILSGHDEFEYAQEAIKLGVTEYLLKPVTVQDMHNVLKKVALQIDQERMEQENLQNLEKQVAANRAVLREKFLLNLLVGAISPAEAVEQSESLDLGLVARYYLVVVIKIEMHDPTQQLRYDECQHIREIVSGLVQSNPDVFLVNKDLEELVLIMKGEAPEYLQEEKNFFLEKIERSAKGTRCKLTIGASTPKMRIAEICQSFFESLAIIQNTSNSSRDGDGMDKAELLKLDKFAVEEYLRCGVKEDFDDFFGAFMLPLGESTFKSPIIKNYVFMDLVLTTARFASELGGNIDQVIPELGRIEEIIKDAKTIDQIKGQAHAILNRALEFRDSQAGGQHVGMIQQAREYLDHHYMDPNISLGEVAAQVGHSPCHFSTVFSRETGLTFKDYLTESRLRKAKELLRMTTLRSSEISYQIGYNDPHYFSYVFRKRFGLSPKEFRLQTHHEEQQMSAEQSA